MKIVKKLFKIVFVLFIIINFVNCSKSDDPTFSTTKINNGSIDSYTGTDFDSIFVFTGSIYGSYFNIKLPVTLLIDGNFSFTLPNPDSKSLTLFHLSRVSISDQKVLKIEYQGGDNGFPIYKGKHMTGKIIKTNVALTNYQQGVFGVGSAFSNYIYVNKNVNIKGTDIVGTSYAGNIPVDYDLTLNAGWNEVVETYTSVINNLPTGKSFTNSIPTGMKWIIDAFITPKDLVGTMWRSSKIGYGYDYEELRFTSTSAGEIWLKYTMSELPIKADTFSFLITENTIAITATNSGERLSGLLWRNTINLQGFTFTKQ